jgi:enamine deaminase RidA (YjgF/YER057c/UK114 family)
MTSVVEFYSPDTMPPTRGYSQIAHVKGGELLYFSGQVALNAKGELVGADYATQLEQIFRNIELGLKAAGASLENLIKLNFFVSSAVPMADVLWSMSSRRISLFAINTSTSRNHRPVHLCSLAVCSGQTGCLKWSQSRSNLEGSI